MNCHDSAFKPTRQRLKNATLEQLEHGADNIQDATTLEEVFETGSREK